MNIFKQFYKSLYSPKDIALFRFQGIGKTILYVFFLTLVSILPSVIFLSMALSTGIDTARTILQEETPAFSIKNGQLTAKTDVPVTINRDDFSLIIDPTGVMTENKLEDQGNSFALLKDKFALTAGGKVETYPYSMLEGFSLSNSDLLDFIDTIAGLKGIIIPVISLFIYLFSSASSFIEISILALIGLAIKNLLGRRLQYRQLWRLAAYSQTLPVVFFMVMALLKTSVPNSFFINWAVAIIVLALSINEIPKPKKAI